ncbi:hypothetical protein EPR50_G00067040 [Perca flavescens]|uniref:Syndecan n=1 Tax=Perca flavescens TaxID=8167 RepID=A0A484DA85_PERFV|nr:syndecan-2-like [Perca flavescens]XP_028437241.1 syndecan-2-like [Perca flavescens]TDH12064.1 hypothetical protein EPR50_G00067040 [Perca flavescens]
MRSLRLLFLVGLASGFISEKLFVSSFSTSDDIYLEGRTSGDLPIDDEDGDDGGSGSGSGGFDEEIFRRFTNFSQTTVSKETVPTQPPPAADSPHNPSTTAATKVKDTETTPFILTNGDSSDEEVTADWFTESSTSKPPSETTATKFGIDITVINDIVEDNSQDRWNVSTPKNHEDEVLIADRENDLKATNGKGRIYEMDSPAEVTSENMWERTEVLAAVIACGVVGFLCAVFLLLLIAYRMKKKDEGSYNLGDTKDSTTAYQKAPTKEFYA